MPYPSRDNRQPPDIFAAYRFADEARPLQLQWLWPNRIPIGKLTLLVGDPGIGKSLLAADLAARVSAGLPWPLPLKPSIPESLNPSLPESLNPSIPESLNPSTSVAPSHRGGVIIVSAEDRLDDILHPRLTAAGADLGSICVLEGVRLDLRTDIAAPLNLSQHLEPLAEAVRAVTFPRLLILDPLPALLAPAADPLATPFRTPSAGLTTVLNALAELAHRHSVAVLAVTHLAKTAGSRPIYRTRGSIAFVAAARSVLLLAPHHDDADRRVLLPVKSVYGPPPPPLQFRILPGPRLDWLPLPALDAPGLSADMLDLTPEARDWLTDALAAGPRPARDLLHDARRCGFSRGTLRRAKRLLGVGSAKGKSAWLWTPPERPESPPPAAST